MNISSIVPIVLVAAALTTGGCGNEGAPSPSDVIESADAGSLWDAVTPPDETDTTTSDVSTPDVPRRQDAGTPIDDADLSADGLDETDATTPLEDTTPTDTTEDTGGGFTVEVTPVDTTPSPIGDSGGGGTDTTDPEDATVGEDDASSIPPSNLWVLNVDNATHRLMKIDVATAEATEVCELPTIASYPSLTFSRTNGLFGSRGGDVLDLIDPCTCEITEVGPYVSFSGMYGITSDYGLNLFGVATIQDQLVAISSNSGVGTGVGPLGVDFTLAGASWSDVDSTVYAINGGDDGLYVIDSVTGEATLIATLDYDFNNVGIEVHPANGVIYACSTAGHLRSVDPITGHVTDIGHMGLTGSCTNLAAPWLKVDCLE